MPVGVQASRGPRAAVPNARVEEALGHLNVFERRSGEQRSWTQLGDFGGPRRSSGNDIAVQTGPDAAYTSGLRLRKLTASLLDAGYTLNPGTTGFLHILCWCNQSNSADATGGAAEDPDTDPDDGVVYNTENPDPRILMFVGGVHPHQGGVASATKNVEIDAAQYASVIPAYDGKNPLVPRNSGVLAMAVQLAAAFPSTDKFLCINRSAGSTTFNERMGTDTRAIYLDWVTLLAAADAYAASVNLTPVIVVWSETGFEAEGDAQSLANGLTPLQAMITQVNEVCAPYLRDGKPLSIFALQPGNPRNDINHDPSTNYPGNPSPDLSNMGKINNVALAMKRLRYGHDSSNAAYAGAADFYPFPGYMLTARGPAAIEANAGVHYLAPGHMEWGEIQGIAYIKLVNGEDPSWPYVTAASRLYTSQTVTLTTSEAGTFNHDLVTDPYSAAAFDHEGVDYTNNGTAKFSTARSASGTSITATYTGLTGITERVKIASGNSPKLKAEVIGTTPPLYVHTAPAFGLGPTLGQRCTWQSDEVYGYSLYTGRPFYKRLLHDELPVTVTLSATTLLAMLTEMGITPTMCLDASDSNCYSGSGSTINDLASGGFTWNYKDSGGTAAVQFTSSGALSSFNFDGNVYLASSGATFADNDHKSTGSGVDIFVVDVPASLSGNQYLLATNADDTTGGGAGPGRVNRLTSTNLFGSVVRAGSGTQVYADNATGTNATGKHVLMLGFDHATTTNWFMMNVNMQYVISPETATESFGTTPSSSAKAGGPYIGSNYTGTYGTEQRLKNGWKIHKAARVPYVAPADLLPLFRTLSGQISKTVATQEP
jgi:hypothetical protein